MSQATGLQPSHETLELFSNVTGAARRRLALRDFREGLGLWRLFFTLGWLDIKLKYRGSVIGPFWLTLSTAVMVCALGFLYSHLFKMVLRDYLPYLALSIILWNFLSAIVGEACTSFLQAESMIRSVRMPFSVHAARVVVRNVLTLLHNFVVIVAVFAIFAIVPRTSALLAIPAFGLWILDGFAACLLLGAFCARFRDVPPVVASVMQIAFFVSPIIWKPELLGAGAKWLAFNPFFTMLEIVRGPLLGYVPGVNIWASAFGFSLLLCVGAWMLFARVRGRLAFWI
ncbi:MAG TPA: ABC transporter permease [Acetobacteraceae bacterium]|nr:ABC transporter permease [Acetobacteraceae bacterium]